MWDFSLNTPTTSSCAPHFDIVLAIQQFRVREDEVAIQHPNKEIRKAIRYAEQHGWNFEKSRGHAFGHLRCGNGCFMPVWSTPRSREIHAKRIRQAVDKCTHQDGGE